MALLKEAALFDRTRVLNGDSKFKLNFSGSTNRKETGALKELPSNFRGQLRQNFKD